jgi:cytochrome c553
MRDLKGVLFLLAACSAAALAGAAESGAPPAGIAVCASCHGAYGEGSTIGAPRLAGQNADYMSHALSMFKAGTRASPIMQPIAQGLSDTDMEILARYFSSQTPPPAEAGDPASPALILAGKQLAETGPAACFSCHGEGGKGNGTRYPSIAGQPAQFIIDRIHEFQERARQKAPQAGSMTAVSTTLTQDQIKATAAYLSRLLGTVPH